MHLLALQGPWVGEYVGVSTLVSVLMGELCPLVGLLMSYESQFRVCVLQTTSSSQTGHSHKSTSTLGCATQYSQSTCPRLPKAKAQEPSCGYTSGKPRHNTASDQQPSNMDSGSLKRRPKSKGFNYSPATSQWTAVVDSQ